jgi:hypothetical protein
MDPYRAFGQYPSTQLGPQSVLALAPGASHAAYQSLANIPVYSLKGPSEDELVKEMLLALASGPCNVKAVGEAVKAEVDQVLLAAAALAKMGLLSIRQAPSGE